MLPGPYILTVILVTWHYLFENFLLAVYGKLFKFKKQKLKSLPLWLHFVKTNDKKNLDCFKLKFCIKFATNQRFLNDAEILHSCKHLDKISPLRLVEPFLLRDLVKFGQKFCFLLMENLKAVKRVSSLALN